ncbi:methyltransferase domain-containing protein [Paenibacillus jamilae]
MLEELSKNLTLQKGMRVLDLGCGTGLTSIYLAQKFDITVFAVDLWISATENYRRFREFGLESQIIPIHADACHLPFAEQYFDAVISVDAYQYFGANELPSPMGWNSLN